MTFCRTCAASSAECSWSCGNTSRQKNGSWSRGSWSWKRRTTICAHASKTSLAESPSLARPSSGSRRKDSKFGLSLIVASQRPSKISPTVLSQCANFVLHRLLNPDDIDHFRKLVPSQSKRLIDQITIVRAGEAVVAGSAFHVPTRVQVQRPNPEPASESSAPFVAWKGGAEPVFALANALTQWGVANTTATEAETRSAPNPPPTKDDDCPF